MWSDVSITINELLLYYLRNIKTQWLTCLSIISRLVDTLVHIGKHMGCYKISLDCSNEKVGFYEKLGFQCKNNIMYIRFDED